MRPHDAADGEPAEKSIFEHWMGMTPEEWDALGTGDDLDGGQTERT